MVVTSTPSASRHCDDDLAEAAEADQQHRAAHAVEIVRLALAVRGQAA